MVEDKPRSRYELHFHAFVPSPLVTEYNKIKQLFQGNLPQLTGNPLHQLPADLPEFTGRQTELEQVLTRLVPATPQEENLTDSSSSHCAIAGPAGIGKSALAIHIAHQLQPNFPDAQFYVNLRGTESQPLEPMEVLADFLQALGTDDHSIPEDINQRANLYHSLLWNKRVLLILDNAHNSAQIRPLLPNSPSCAALVTSRKHLATMDDATTFELGVMKPSEALELFQKWVGVERIHSEPEAVQPIINFCGGFPLAIRLAGSTIRNFPEWRLEDYANQLSQEWQRLNELRLSHVNSRASFAVSFNQLDQSSARLFRLLGLLKGQNFTPTVAVALLESEPAITKLLVNLLVNLRLLEPDGEGRYCFHDLVRLFAKEQLAQEEPAQARQATRLRIARYYLEVSEVMNLALKPETQQLLAQVLPEGTKQHWFLGALSWFEQERINLLASVEWAYQTEDWDILIPLVSNLVNFFNIDADYTNWEHTHLLAIEASQKLGNLLLLAQTLTNLGNVHALRHTWEKAHECYEQSLVIFAESQDCLGMAKTTGNLANVYSQQSNLEKARECYEQSLVIFRELKDFYGEGQTLANMGIFYLQQGDEEQAGRLWQQALSKLPSDLPKSQRVAQWLELIQVPNLPSENSEGNTQMPEKTDVKPWNPLDLARNALQWFRRS